MEKEKAPAPWYVKRETREDIDLRDAHNPFFLEDADGEYLATLHYHDFCDEELALIASSKEMYLMLQSVAPHAVNALVKSKLEVINGC